MCHVTAGKCTCEAKEVHSCSDTWKVTVQLGSSVPRLDANKEGGPRRRLAYVLLLLLLGIGHFELVIFSLVSSQPTSSSERVHRRHRNWFVTPCLVCLWCKIYGGIS